MTTKKANRKQKKSNAGRPTKLTKQIHDKIVKAVKQGNYVEVASAYAGISKDTLYNWLKRGAREKERVSQNTNFKVKQSERPFVEFSDAIEKAQAESEMSDLQNITMASKMGDWKASAWRLERKFPDRWGRKDRMNMDVKSEHTDRKEVHVTQQIEEDPESKELLKQLFRRQTALGENDD